MDISFVRSVEKVGYTSKRNELRGGLRAKNSVPMELLLSLSLWAGSENFSDV